MDEYWREQLIDCLENIQMNIEKLDKSYIATIEPIKFDIETALNILKREK